MLYLDWEKQTNKKNQLRIIKKREMWKYDWLYDSGEGGEEGYEAMINS